MRTDTAAAHRIASLTSCFPSATCWAWYKPPSPLAQSHSHVLCAACPQHRGTRVRLHGVKPSKQNFIPKATFLRKPWPDEESTSHQKHPSHRINRRLSLPSDRQKKSSVANTYNSSLGITGFLCLPALLLRHPAAQGTRLLHNRPATWTDSTQAAPTVCTELFEDKILLMSLLRGYKKTKNNFSMNSPLDCAQRNQALTVPQTGPLKWMVKFLLWKSRRCCLFCEAEINIPASSPSVISPWDTHAQLDEIWVLLTVTATFLSPAFHRVTDVLGVLTCL